MRKLLFILAASMIGCVDATVTEPSICDSQALNQLPTASAAAAPPVGLPPVSFSQTLNLSDTLSKINDVADTVSIHVNQLMLDNSSGNMSWLNHVEVDIAVQGMPSKVVTQYDCQATDRSAASINLPVQLDNNTLYSYLSKGPVTLTFTLSGNVPASVPNLSGTMCLSADAKVSKSL